MLNIPDESEIWICLIDVRRRNGLHGMHANAKKTTTTKKTPKFMKNDFSGKFSTHASASAAATTAHCVCTPFDSHPSKWKSWFRARSTICLPIMFNFYFTYASRPNEKNK